MLPTQQQEAMGTVPMQMRNIDTAGFNGRCSHCKLTCPGQGPGPAMQLTKHSAGGSFAKAAYKVGQQAKPHIEVRPAARVSHKVEQRHAQNEEGKHGQTQTDLCIHNYLLKCAVHAPRTHAIEGSTSACLGT